MALVPLPLKDHAALVTGASRGLGRAIAVALSHAGARVALVARTQHDLADTARACVPGTAFPVVLDLSSVGSGQAAVEAAEAAVGPLRILVHAAAPVFPLQRIMQLSDGDVDAALGAGLAVAAGLCRAAVPSMLGHRSGRIVMISSLAASHGAAGSALYSAVKAGLEGLCRGLAVDHGRHGVTVNAVAVGFCDTERFRARADAAQRQRLVEATALKRIPTPEEVAGVVAFVCSPAAGVITGATLQVTAGSHLNNLW